MHITDLFTHRTGLGLHNGIRIAGFTIDELKTRLRGADDDHIDASPVSKEGVGGGVRVGGGIVAPTAAANANVFIKKKQSDHEYSYAELNIIAPSSM